MNFLSFLPSSVQFLKKQEKDSITIWKETSCVQPNDLVRNWNGPIDNSYSSDSDTSFSISSDPHTVSADIAHESESTEDEASTSIEVSNGSATTKFFNYEPLWFEDKDNEGL